MSNKNFNNKQFNRRQPLRLTEDMKIQQPLTKEYEDYGKTYLYGGTAFEKAESLKKMPNTQMRKVLDVVKEAAAMAKLPGHLEIARNKLFSVIPMTAYNTGRAKNDDKSLYETLLTLLYININEATIQTVEDIETFDEFFTSIIAYHRYFGEGEKNA